MSQIKGDKNHLVKREEDRNLQQDRQTARRGIDLFLLVERHHLFLHFLLVVTGLFFQGLHLRLQLFHLGHRDVGFIRQRHQQRLDEKRQTNDCPAHVAKQAIEPVQHKKDRLGEVEKPAPVNRIDEIAYPAFLLVAAQDFIFLGPGK